MVSAQKREKFSTLLHSLETEDRKWLQQKLMRQDTASLLRDEKGLSDQELLAAESWYWQQYAESTSMRARRAHARLWCIFMLLRYGGLRLVEALDRGEELPVDLDGAVIYYVGPSPARPGRAIGAAGPTTAGRMDAYTPTLLARGLRGMIGKGYRKPEVVEAMKRHGVPYLAAVGGAGALISQRIKKYTVLAYPDLGPEAVAALEVEDFPAIVVIDSTGDNYYETGQAPYRKL